MNFLESQQYLINFISIREKVVLISFFQKKYHAVFIFHFFMNLQWQNVTNVTVTYVANISVESFWNHCSSVIWTCLIILQNCYFSELTVKCSLENNSLKHRSVLVWGMYFSLFLTDIWWNLDCTRVIKDGIISEGNFIYTKIWKHLEPMFFVWGWKPYWNHLLDVKKLSVFRTYVKV